MTMGKNFTDGVAVPNPECRNNETGQEWNNSEPLLTIVTINLNNEAGLDRTLHSFAQQRVQKESVELIVVDGGSADGSSEIARKYNAGGNVTWSSEPDRGVYDAMNKGTRKGAGRYFLYLNAGDAFATPDALSEIYIALRTNPTWLIVGAWNLGGGVRKKSVIGNLPHSWYRHALGVQPHCHQACFFRADLVSALSGYSERFGFVGDFDFILRAGLVSSPKELPEILIAYEGGGLSESSSDEIPLLLHAVRTARLELAGGVRSADRLWSRVQQQRRRISRRRRQLQNAVLRAVSVMDRFR